MEGEVVWEKDVESALSNLGSGSEQYPALELGNFSVNFNSTSALKAVTFVFPIYQREYVPYSLGCFCKNAADICR